MIRVKSNEVIGELVAERMFEKDQYQHYLQHIAGAPTWVYPYASTVGGTTTSTACTSIAFAAAVSSYNESGSDCVATGLEEFKALSNKSACCEEDVCNGENCS